MADREPSKAKSDPKKKTGKFHYNPVNMAGKEAGKFKEQDEDAKQDGQDNGGDRLRPRKT